MKKVFLILMLTAASLIARDANTSMNFPSELTSSFQFKEFLNGMTFSRPVCLRTPPGENSLFIVEKRGVIYKVSNINNPQKVLYMDISSKVDDGGESGLLSIAFHPDYTDNKTFYAFYTSPHNGSRHQFISRFTENGSSFVETVLIRQLDQAGNHNGGDMHFGPDGYLYISLGDEGNQNDALNNSQRIDKDFFSAVMRIDVDRNARNLEPNTHPAVIKINNQANYKVPVDNPWVGASSFNGSPVNAANVRTEFYAVGFRNPWRMSFDPSGNLWIGDVGQGQREEIDLIPYGQKGMNFGWNFREGFIAGPGTSPTGVTADDPVHDYVRSNEPNFDGRSVTGGVFYSGNQIPSLKNKYIFGDYISGNVWHLSKNGSQVSVDFIANEKSISAFGHNPETGEVLICKYDTGKILKLVEGTGNEDQIPATLSATGAFSDLTNLKPESGVEHYEPVVTFWSDYAIKKRWFSLPNINQKYGFKEEGGWNFPAGAVWIKHFDLEMERGNPASAVRVETRFLVKTAAGAYGLSYKWNAAGTEATLVPPEGENVFYNIKIDGVSTPKTWSIPSRSSCLECHTANAGFALSFNTRQLNRVQNIFGSNQNILTALHNEGYLDKNPGSPGNLGKHYAASDNSASLEQKARSYMDVNCSYCHQDGGPTPAEFDARALLTNFETGLLNGIPLNNGGDSSRRLILPGNPDKSVILSRISETQGFSRMPPIATTELDHGGMELIRMWIESLNNAKPQPGPLQPDANGLISVEAENADLVVSGSNNHDWILTSDNDATGKGAYNAYPDIGLNQNTAYVNASPRLDYRVNFDRAGTFYVWVRGKASGNLGAGDSLHVGLNGQAVSTADRISSFNGTYRWSQNTMDGSPAVITVPSAGEHTVNVWMREDGFVFDKLVLTPLESFAPSGNGPAESSRTNGAGFRSVSVSIDPYNANDWDFFQAKISNNSTNASLASVSIKSLGTGTFDIFENGSQFSVGPDLGKNNDGVDSQTVTLTFGGNGLAPGASDQNGINNNRSDIDKKSTGFEVTVRFTDGTGLTGNMSNVGDDDDGDTEFWHINLSSSDNPEDVFSANFKTADIGNSNAAITENNGLFELNAAGADIWGRSDEFGFAYIEWSGDVTLVAKVNSLEHVHDWSKSGIMIRSSLDAGSRHASMFVTHKRVSAHWRLTDGGTTSPDNIESTESKPPMWVKLMREGNVFRAYYSLDGGTWHPNGQRTIDMPEKVFIGLALSSHQRGTLATSSISNVEVKKPSSEVFVRRLILTNADSKTDIQEMKDRMVIDRTALGTGNFDIRAELSEEPGSVEFRLNEVLHRYEHSIPYYFNGDNAWSPAPGDYVIEATPFSEGSGAGIRGETLKLRISIK